MIVGHGIDLEQLDRIEKAYLKRPKFAERVLTDRELSVFQQLEGLKKMTYLAGRWAAKEAFAKAYGTGIGRLRFRDIEVLNDEKGRPILTSSVFQGDCHVSISHSGPFVQASVILEEL